MSKLAIMSSPFSTYGHDEQKFKLIYILAPAANRNKQQPRVRRMQAMQKRQNQPLRQDQRHPRQRRDARRNLTLHLPRQTTAALHGLQHAVAIYRCFGRLGRRRRPQSSNGPRLSSRLRHHHWIWSLGRHCECRGGLECCCFRCWVCRVVGGARCGSQWGEEDHCD